jgi:RNA polymerase sigma-54 factor
MSESAYRLLRTRRCENREIAPFPFCPLGSPRPSRRRLRRPAPPSLGRIVHRDNDPAFTYRHAAFAREYRFDETMIGELRASGAIAGDQVALLHRLRLINSRNRLTHAVMNSLLVAQRDFLATGDPLALVPLPQAHLSRCINERAGLPLVADAGRISRLVRSLAITMPDGKALPLTRLFPSERQLHCHRLDLLLKNEKQLLLAGEIARPWSDAQLAALLAQRHGTRLSRRSIAAIRHQLAVPDSRRRAALADYRTATEGFSALLPLTPSTLTVHVPCRAGVYEIRAPIAAENRCPADAVERLPVVYIGSTQDLRKRLADHLRGSSGNMMLYRHLAEGRAKVRFRIVEENWRGLERRLYLAYRETFGVPPPCNRMSP